MFQPKCYSCFLCSVQSSNFVLGVRVLLLLLVICCCLVDSTSQCLDNIGTKYMEALDMSFPVYPQPHYLIENRQGRGVSKLSLWPWRSFASLPCQCTVRSSPSCQPAPPPQRTEAAETLLVETRMLRDYTHNNNQARVEASPGEIFIFLKKAAGPGRMAGSHIQTTHCPGANSIEDWSITVSPIR